MTEDQLRQVERWLDTADAKAIAAVLVAAIVRTGQIGIESADAFINHAPVDCDQTWTHFLEGLEQLSSAFEVVRSA